MPRSPPLKEGTARRLSRGFFLGVKGADDEVSVHKLAVCLERFGVLVQGLIVVIHLHQASTEELIFDGDDMRVQRVISKVKNCYSLGEES
jgi:hypothetical protein